MDIVAPTPGNLSNVGGLGSAELAARAFLVGFPNASTRKAYALHLRKWFEFLEPHNVDPMTVQRAHVELWLRTLENSGLSARTRTLKLATIRSFYGYCVDEGWLVTNPASRVKGPSVERKSPRGALNSSQVADLISGAEKLGMRESALVMLLAFNGLRIGETCAANVEDLFQRGFALVLDLPKRKGGKSGEAVLSQPLAFALTEYLGERTSGPLFLNNEGNRLTRTNAQRILDRAARSIRGQHPKVTPHVLRHSWCTIAAELGVDLFQIQLDGGWSDSRMVDYYHNANNNPLKAATHHVAAQVMSRI